MLFLWINCIICWYWDIWNETYSSEFSSDLTLSGLLWINKRSFVIWIILACRNLFKLICFSKNFKSHFQRIFPEVKICHYLLKPVKRNKTLALIRSKRSHSSDQQSWLSLDLMQNWPHGQPYGKKPTFKCWMPVA